MDKELPGKKKREKLSRWIHLEGETHGENSVLINRDFFPQLPQG
jgi:hypothetical protein